MEEARKRELEEAKYREMEPGQTARLQEIVEGAYQRVTLVEEEVEKVMIAAAPLEVEAGEDLESMMMEAITETEARVAAASAAMDALKAVLTSAQKEYSQMIPKVKAMALEQLQPRSSKNSHRR